MFANYDCKLLHDITQAACTYLASISTSIYHRLQTQGEQSQYNVRADRQAL